MNDLDFYLDEVKKVYSLPSDRQLAIALSLPPVSVHHYRKKTQLPSDDTMIRLANMAGVSKEQALLELSYWRSEGEAKETYGEILKKVSLKATISAIGFAAALNLTAPAAAQAAPPASAHNGEIIYIMENITYIPMRTLYRYRIAAIC